MPTCSPFLFWGLWVPLPLLKNNRLQQQELVPTSSILSKLEDLVTQFSQGLHGAIGPRCFTCSRADWRLPCCCLGVCGLLTQEVSCGARAEEDSTRNICPAQLPWAQGDFGTRVPSWPTAPTLHQHDAIEMAASQRKPQP